MFYTLLLLSCFWAGFARADSVELSEDIRKKESGYLLIHPKVFISGRNETVCLSLHDVDLPTKILIDLKIDDYHNIVSQNVDTDNSCFKLFVKPERVKYSQYATIHLQIQLNGTIYSSFNTDPIFVVSNDKLTFIETDKSNYKPGDVVKFRILILNNDLKPLQNYNVTDVKIINPGGNTVAIWENLPTRMGFLQLEHELHEDVTLGKWKIEVNSNKYKSFTVKRYVLPRYKVTLSYPKLIHTSRKNVDINVCARYTYGKPVQGIALIKISSAGLLYEPLTKIQQINDGCVTFDLTNVDLALKSNFTLHVVATVTELQTNQVESDTGRIEITSRPYEFEFSDENLYFQPGLPYSGKLKILSRLVREKEDIFEICYHVAIKNKWNLKRKVHCKNFTLEADKDYVNFYVYPFKSNVYQLHLKARVFSNSQSDFGDGLQTMIVNRWYSPSLSYIYLNHTKTNSKCRSTQHFTVYYTSDKMRRNTNVTFYYMIKSLDDVIKYRKLVHMSRKQQSNLTDTRYFIGEVDRFTKSTSEFDKFSIKFKLDTRIISDVQFLIYFVTKDGEVVSASANVHIEKCLSHPVKAIWSDSDISPGNLATMKITAAPNSVCSVSSSDRAVNFMENWKPLNIHTILSPYVQEKAPRANFKLCQPHNKKKLALENLEELKSVDTYLDLRKKRKRRSYMSGNTDEFDSSDVFDSLGTSVISNLKLLTKVCQKDQRFNRPDERFTFTNGAEFLTNPASTVDYDANADDSESTTLRSYFPETWLWELVTVGDDGNVEINRHTSDTITNWTTSVLCVSDKEGPGISVPQDLRTFQPFFIDLLLPNSVKREEVLQLRAMLFNYLNYSLPVRIVLVETHDFDMLDPDFKENGITYCISASSSVLHTFRIKPVRLGDLNVTVVAEIDTSYPGECGPEFIVNKRDVVYKTIQVEPEGYRNEISKSALLCTSDSYVTNNVTWDIDLPEDIIKDSAKTKLILNADLMGPTLHNLEKLINMPTGCGEQIMSTMAPNLYALRYLTATKQINSKLYARIIKNLKVGYQKILDYVHDDGSFSAFGYHDEAGSMFLTAFVLRTLKMAKSYVFVDKSIIDKATQWIISHQLENGCFPAISHVFQYMGGTSYENSTASLTAYVMISLLESDVKIPDKIKTNAKFCIRANHQPDKYTLAISTYALYLLEWYSEANRYLQRVLDLATKDGELMWWSNAGGPPALHIEMTSYVLMSLLQVNATQNLVHASSVVRWLSTQRRSYGSFISTQDTSVALDALSRYAAKVKSKSASVNVEITADGDIYAVQVQSTDKLSNKELNFDGGVPKNVKVSVKGKGCILAQVLSTFHLEHLMNSEAFKLGVDVNPVSTIDKCSIAILSPCISYSGSDLHSNMAVLEVTMPSGYEADSETLHKLVEESHTKLKRFEQFQNKVVLYFIELTNEPVCVPFTITEQAVVENHVDAVVSLYDYYKPELKVSTSYKINKCRPKVIKPTFGAKIGDNFKDSNGTDEDNNQSTKASEKQGQFRTRRNAHQPVDNISFGLNDNFIDLDIELAVPEGEEGNMPVYVKPEVITQKPSKRHNKI